MFLPIKSSMQFALKKSKNEMIFQGIRVSKSLAQILLALKYAYVASFTLSNITSGFAKSVLWPLNMLSVLQCSIPNSKYISSLVTPLAYTYDNSLQFSDYVGKYPTIIG